MGENIGAAARVMVNFGLSDLRLVNPRDGWPNEVAERNGAGAFDHVSVSVFDDLEHAIEDLNTVYATSARRRDLNIPVYRPSEITIKPQTGIVFGRERTGLENTHISRVNGVIELPVNPDFPSLNLAQAVGVTVYALCHDGTGEDANKGHDAAPQKDVKNLLSRLEGELNTRGFFKSDGAKTATTNDIRALISRLNPTEPETRLLHGIITSLAQK